jgi:hypothetical protein
VKRHIRFFSKDMGSVGWTRLFDISDDDKLASVCEQIQGLAFERVEVVEEMTKDDFETQFMVSLS